MNTEDVDLYEFLDLKRDDLPPFNSKENRIIIKNILDSKFREMAPMAHPDRGGSAEKFKLLLRAVTVLGDENLRNKYENNRSEIYLNSFAIDWNKYFNYNPDSIGADIGHSLADEICAKLDKNLFFSPKTREDGYNWIFNIETENVKLFLSIVYDEEDILSLTDGSNIDISFPFKIYLYFPTNKLQKKNHNGAKFISYLDRILIQTTNSHDIRQYIENDLINDLKLINEGKFIYEVSHGFEEKPTMKEEDMKKFDKSLLNEIFDIKSPKLKNNEMAGDFLSQIPKKQITRITERIIQVKSSSE